ncbi:MAG: hypothetical protein ACE361_01860 [Aureliella sp.]
MSDPSKLQADEAMQTSVEPKLLSIANENADALSTAVLDWADGLVREAMEAECLTVGVMSGGRSGNDPRSLDRLLQAITSRMKTPATNARVLAVRCIDAELATSEVDVVDRIPVAQRSPLGSYCEVELVSTERKRIAPGLNNLPNWLAEWKNAFQLILVDIGAIDSVAAKSIGRLCDGCYLLLGPYSCGSQEWIMQHVAWHNRSGSTVCGTIVAEHKAA